jgi:hypothetical protein
VIVGSDGMQLMNKTADVPISSWIFMLASLYVGGRFPAATPGRTLPKAVVSGRCRSGLIFPMGSPRLSHLRLIQVG